MPAAFNNLVGLKPTKGLLSTRGVVPACRSLDCVSIFCNTVQDGATILDVIEGFDPDDCYSRPVPGSVTRPVIGPFRFGRLRGKDLEFFGMPECGTLYEAACDRFVSQGGTPVEIDFEPFAEAGKLMFAGPWVAERRAAIAALMEIETDAILEVTKSVLRPAENYTAMDAFTALHKLLRLRRQVRNIVAGLDTLVVPTAPRPFLLEDMNRDPITLNNRLGHYSYFANLLDLCAVALPNGVLPNGIPMGVTLLAEAWSDRALIALARRLEAGTSGMPFALTSRAPPARASLTDA